MKTLSFLALLAASCLLTSLASANDSLVLKGYAAKKHKLQSEIDGARAQVNTYQQAGKQLALNQND